MSGKSGFFVDWHTCIGLECTFTQERDTLEDVRVKSILKYMLILVNLPDEISKERRTSYLAFCLKNTLYTAVYSRIACVRFLKMLRALQTPEYDVTGSLGLPLHICSRTFSYAPAFGWFEDKL